MAHNNLMPQLTPSDAGELADILVFLREWLTADSRLEASLARCIGHPAYGVPQLRDDLGRFIFLLGGDDGERLFGLEPAGDPRPGC